MNLIERYENLGVILEKRPKIKKTIRINTLKIGETELVSRLKKKGIKLKKVPYLDLGYEYESSISLPSTPEYLQGYFYIQEAASQIPAQELDPKPNDVVLDMAASPGSKTTQMAQMMKNKGVLVAIDIDNQRMNKLKNNLERLSITNTVLFMMDGRKISKLKKQFDKILLDAPCSGNYCIEKDFLMKRKKKDFQNRSWLQKELLEEAYKNLKPGGTLVYSTCSLEPEEDELVINWFINKFKDMKLQNLKINIGEEGIINPFSKELSKEITKTRRFWPQKTGTQGFFIAKLIKQK